jgi:hypothetical protein
MKDINEMLREKEMDLARLRAEVAALRFVAPLLADQGGELSENKGEYRSDPEWSPPLKRNKWPLKAGGQAPTYSDS